MLLQIWYSGSIIAAPANLGLDCIMKSLKVFAFFLTMYLVVSSLGTASRLKRRFLPDHECPSWKRYPFQNGLPWLVVASIPYFDRAFRRNNDKFLHARTARTVHQSSRNRLWGSHLIAKKTGSFSKNHVQAIEFHMLNTPICLPSIALKESLPTNAGSSKTKGGMIGGTKKIKKQPEMASKTPSTGGSSAR